MADDNVKRLSAALEDVWNGGRVEMVGTYYHDDFVGHFPEPWSIKGSAELTEVVAALKKAFPDFHEVVHEMIPAGDKVIARYTISGTQSGDYDGEPATNKRFEVPSVDIYRFANGRVAEHWGVMDFYNMYKQLGWKR